ncbi:MAG: hypothetical protein KIC77_00370 [Clostridiales bacterium]|nr:hypothetical protein [Clostridiales bacterium]
MEKQKQTEITRNIDNRFGSINKTDHSNIEINIIRWNNGRKKLDIRVWSSDGKCPKKGVTFNREEYFQLIRILSGIDPMLIDSGKTFSKEISEPQKRQPVAAEEEMLRCREITGNACEEDAGEIEDYIELDEESTCENTEQQSAS